MSHTPSAPLNLLNYDRNGLAQLLTDMGEPGYRAGQLMQWLHQYGQPIEAMTNLSKALRQKLSDNTVIAYPEVVSEHRSQDGTCKWLMKVGPNNHIETVFIPEDDRGTLCVSSQVGCALNCSFCSTATQGFSRNLTVAEIIGQVYVAVRRLSQDGGKHDRQVTNVVMMGMGEPLLNTNNVVTAMAIMMDDFAYGLSKRRITLSTSGVVPELIRLKTMSDVSLAVSLHAPNDALRNQLVPINKKYPLNELMAVCRDYFPAHSRRRITYEYVMLEGVNDSLTHARELIQLFKNMPPPKINLIPFNPFPQNDHRCSSRQTIIAFQQALLAADMVATIRKTRGDDIDAACGQLVGDFVDKTKRRERMLKAAQVNQVATSSDI